MITVIETAAVFLALMLAIGIIASVGIRQASALALSEAACVATAAELAALALFGMLILVLGASV